MGALLEIDHVDKSFGGGGGLTGVSFTVQPGEMVVLWGPRRSGRSSLLRIAAGIETADRGSVRFDGHSLCDRDPVAYCLLEFLAAGGPRVFDQMVSGQLARRVSQSVAQREARLALDRAGAGEYAMALIGELKPAEAVRVSIARALTARPRLLVIDEPALGVGMVERDAILGLLRSLADEGVAILASASEGTELSGADRVLRLSGGRLLGGARRDPAPVGDLAAARRARIG